MVTDGNLQEQIAKVLGMRMATDEEAAAVYGNIALPYRPWINSSGDCARLPNWPTDRNASYELIKGRILDKGVPRTARQECIIYLEGEGWRWVECDSCEGEPHGVSEDCTDCNGDGGEWEKEG